MDRTAFGWLGLVACVALCSPVAAAPVPKDEPDWWLEIMGPNREHYFVRVATGERRKVKTPPPNHHFGSRSPDGKMDAYDDSDSEAFHKGVTRPLGGTRHDIRVRAVGEVGPGRALFRGPDSYRSPVWTPDGKRLVFQSDRDGGWTLYSSNPDGSDLKPLSWTTGFRDDPDDIALLPDGRAVTFVSRKRVESRRSPNSKCYWWTGHLVVADGVRDRLLSRDEAVGWYAVAPNGIGVAYDRRLGLEGQEVELVVHDLGSGRSRRLRIDPLKPNWEWSSGRIVWRPDGRALALKISVDISWGKFPEDLEPSEHVVVVEVEPDGLQPRWVRVGGWGKNAEGVQHVGYGLTRWVSADDVAKDAARK